ncbi:hypothetical protein PISMIDRAFT_536622 [Pisolithus microcarpus 441]|uniref:Uncharacterized protein n=1 Tax=Pisolithus microcarpus 441 TaxID=765257 RepID=A0A0C9YAP5_9AGAM|nr:hypothetical protein PISMIDRAFT_536622 [Pisolithus microcarpus 441]
MTTNNEDFLRAPRNGSQVTVNCHGPLEFPTSRDLVSKVYQQNRYGLARIPLALS